MKKGIQLEILWFDEHVIELRVCGSNGQFAGNADCYIGYDCIKNLAATFRGFPSTQEDRREFELGNFDPENGGGGARFKLWCADALGHVALEVSFRNVSNHQPQTACFILAVEHADIDHFVKALDSTKVAEGSAASLRDRT